MEAYSMDLRQRVVQACDAVEGTRREIAACFQVSESWIRRLLKRRRETGSIAPLPGGRGPEPMISGARRERLQKLVQEHPDATLGELQRRLRLKCGVSTVQRALKRLGLSYKKNCFARPNRTVQT